MNGTFYEYLAPINVNYFDLSIDDSVPYINIQSNLFSKKKKDLRLTKNKNSYYEDIILITKFKKFKSLTKSKFKNKVHILSNKNCGLVSDAAKPGE